MKHKTAGEQGTNSEPLPVHSEHEEVTRQLIFFSVNKTDQLKKLASKCGTPGIENQPEARPSGRKNASSDWRKEGWSWAEATD